MKLELKMDNKTFAFLVIIVFLLLPIIVLTWNDTPILIERYNCSCPEEESLYNDIEWKSFETKHSEIELPNFEDCEEVTCDCYEEFGCMAKCYKC